VAVTINDIVPVAGTLQTFLIGRGTVDLPKASPGPVFVAATVPWTNTAGGAQIIQAVIQPGFLQDTGDDQATRLIFVGRPAQTLQLSDNVALLVDPDGDGKATPGDILQYTIHYTNTGSTDLTGASLVEQYAQSLLQVPYSISTGGAVVGNTIDWNLGTIAAGSSGSVTYDVAIKPWAQFPATTTPVVDNAFLTTQQTATIGASASILVYGNNTTTTALASSANDSVYGTTVTFTATVAASSPLTPTGMVTFYNGTTVLGRGTLNAQGLASFRTAALPVSAAPYAITAVYGGDSNNQSSTSSVLYETITPAELVITPANQARVYGQANPVLTVSYAGFVDGDTPGSLTTQPSVTTTATITSPVGTYPITASGAVDPNYTISYVAGTLTVTRDATTNAASTSAATSPFGQLVTLSATVSANAPGSGTPTGTVDFVDTTTGNDLGSAVLSGGSASVTVSTLPVGSNAIAVLYSGDGDFLASSVNSLTITVSQSIIVLDPTAGAALSLTSGASINLAGMVYVDSSSPSALSASGNATINASTIDVHGGVQKSGKASFSQALKTSVSVLPDPLATLPQPSTSGLTNYGTVNLSGNSSATIKPGVYTGITVSGNASLTFNSGLFIIAGGGFTVSANANVAASGVTIFNAGSNYPNTGGSFGSIALSSKGTFNFTPPGTGTYAGIAIFQSRDNIKPITVSTNASSMAGAIYAPAAQLAATGSAQLNSAIIVDTMTMSGSGIANSVTLDAPSGTVAYSPAQIQNAYGLIALPLDGTGQTIAIVDAYDDPSIYQAVDAFDGQFGLTASGATLYQQYGPSSSFLTVLSQWGQATSLPSTDPNGPGLDNWEVEEALDVEWAHAIAPGAQIILVEANSQSLPDLMASTATAASQPGVSVVSMSWGFAEGQAVFAADEAAYDSVFNVPGVTFVASTGDYGAADPEYPAYSPNVVAVGGTSLTLNTDNSYNSETGWGYYSSSVGASIGSGGGVSLYEPEPAYEQGVQSLGMRTTPDVALVADPATGAWIADSYNLDPSNPFEVVGGTSLSAPAWAGLLAIVNQGRAASGAAALNSTGPTDAQQALYSLPQSDYNTVTSGSNGYSAGAGYNLVTGLGTPVANTLVRDLVAYAGPGTTYSGPTVGPLQDATLSGTWAGGAGTTNAFNVFGALTVTDVGLNPTRVSAVGHSQAASPEGTNALRFAEQPLSNVRNGLSTVNRRAPGDRLPQPSAPPAPAHGLAVDQVLGVVLDADSDEALIHDLAFGRILSGAHKVKRSAAPGAPRSGNIPKMPG
jgi:hypothetical protein